MNENNYNSSLSVALKFEEDTILNLKKLYGDSNIQSPITENRRWRYMYTPDAVIEEGLQLKEISENIDTRLKTFVEISYILSPAKLNHIISICKSGNFNFLIIYKNTRHLNLLDKDTLFERFKLYIKRDTDIFNTSVHISSEIENINIEYSLIKKLKTIIQTKNYSLFLGAGVSIDAGLPNWSDLMKKIITNIEIDNTNAKDHKFTEFDYEDIKYQCFDSSLIIGQYLKTYSSFENLKDIAQKSLYQEFNNTNDLNLINSIINLVIEICPKSIITYNYDDLIENSLQNNQDYKTPTFATITSANSDITATLPIYHVHGFIPQNGNGVTNDIVLTEETYHELYQKPFHWSNIVQLNALNNTVCIFIGFSMSDPNLRRLLDISMNNRTSSDNYDNTIPHYVFLKRDNLKPACPACVKNKNNEEIKEKIMNRLGLNVIWFDEFKDLPDKLNELLKKEESSDLEHTFALKA